MHLSIPFSRRFFTGQFPLGLSVRFLHEMRFTCATGFTFGFHLVRATFIWSSPFGWLFLVPPPGIFPLILSSCPPQLCLVLSFSFLHMPWNPNQSRLFGVFLSRCFFFLVLLFSDFSLLFSPFRNPRLFGGPFFL